ncbi:ammonium transporter [Aphanothece sacrum]|uniref:Ammonium transporter n=1 Tax=Aphanothece sacrum FPU1 TaxID=1920663 RepID=A0A401IHN2_APHSA|nr:ammonium transporter [Aphanothece sacrum]GBF80815.1 ammonium transporter [Aphanothece sacrum FPU1]GBF83310.1 ammonium transporter [Aphanothece sacrum FPU3]
MLKKILTVGLIIGVLLGFILITPALAEPISDGKLTAIQTSVDTAFMLICAALVLMMTPALAFFYGGFVAKGNILNTLMMSFVSMGIVGVTWILWGYSLSFDPGSPFIGGLEWLGLNGVSPEATGYLPQMPYEAGLAADKVVTSYSPTISNQTFMMFQAMFAIISPALISGAIVERMSFAAYSLFVGMWSTLVYCPMAHMVWSKGGFFGLFGGLGALDFAGGTVIHIATGVSALTAAIVIGPRRKYPHQISAPHNVPFILLGAGLLWFGWFGFNAGSALASGSLAVSAFVATNTGAASAMIMWLILEKVLRGKATAIGAASGAVAGLVGITPACGFVTPLAAILIGAITATCCFFAISLKVKLGIDDSLDTYPVHGVGGTIGALLTGVFATTSINAAGKDGLLYGNPQQVLVQLATVVVTYILAGSMTFIILKVLDATVGLRLTPEKESQGMDINEHGEEGYAEEFLGGVSNAIHE